MRKTALVLSGGGAAGAFQAGVIKQLVASEVEIDAVYGTSAGALNAAAFSILGADGLIDIWKNIGGLKDIFRINKWLFWTLGMKAKGLYSHWPLEKLVDSVLAQGKPKIPVTVTRVNLLNGKLEYVNSRQKAFRDAVISSACIPVFVTPHQHHVDGGTRENTPLSKPIKDGYDRIIVVMANNYVRNVSKRKTVGNWLSTGLRSLSIVKNEHLLEDLKMCHRLNSHPDYKEVEVDVYYPKKRTPGVLSFSPARIRDAIDVGLEDYPEYLEHMLEVVS